jgi:hypothetical protein
MDSVEDALIALGMLLSEPARSREAALSGGSLETSRGRSVRMPVKDVPPLTVAVRCR